MLKVFNTLTKEKEEFKPIEKGKVKIYVCGPTVYSEAHIGHARTYIAFDVIIRFLEYLGYKVIYVRNITDVGHLREDVWEDRIIVGAKKEKVHPMELVDKYMLMFFEQCKKLGLRRPNIQPRASAHILEMWEMIEKLIEKGYAYKTEDGSIYFDVNKFEDYGKLSGVKKEKLIKHRIEPAPGKKNLADFALWKSCSEDYPLKWKSPWGLGFPGWHIECSVMGMKYLGKQFDIHGGAKDLIFPHHENEIAQSEAYSGKKFVNYWLHTGLVKIRGEKMSKSKGNIISLKEILEKYDPEVIRIWVISNHYRSEVDFSEKNIEESKKILSRIYNTLSFLDEIAEEKELKVEELKAEEKEFYDKVLKLKEEFIEAMNDDFNTPLALSKYLELSSSINEFFVKSENGKLANFAKEVFVELGKIFGLFQGPKEIPKIQEKLINEILKLREEFRKEGKFEISDRIREVLTKSGVKVEDTEKGTKWKIQF